MWLSKVTCYLSTCVLALVWCWRGDSQVTVKCVWVRIGWGGGEGDVLKIHAYVSVGTTVKAFFMTEFYIIYFITAADPDVFFFSPPLLFIIITFVYFMCSRLNENILFCSNWRVWHIRALSGCGYSFLCMPFVFFVCLCVSVCRQWGHWCWKMCPHFFFFFLPHGAGLLWQPCWASLMSHMCHCGTFSSETTAWRDQNGLFILSISSPPFVSASVSLSFCHSLVYSLWVLDGLETFKIPFFRLFLCQWAFAESLVWIYD